MLPGWTMKLTELTNISYISDRVACIIKVNIKKNSRETMKNLVFSEGRMDSCYFVTTLGNFCTYVKQQ